MADYDTTNKGVAFKNDYKTEERHPTYKGKGNFNGIDFEFGIWIKESEKGKFLTFSFSEPYEKKIREQEQSGYDKAKAVAQQLKPDDTDYDSPIDLSSIPFN